MFTLVEGDAFALLWDLTTGLVDLDSRAQKSPNTAISIHIIDAVMSLNMGCGKLV